MRCYRTLKNKREALLCDKCDGLSNSNLYQICALALTKSRFHSGGFQRYLKSKALSEDILLPYLRNYGPSHFLDGVTSLRPEEWYRFLAELHCTRPDMVADHISQLLHQRELSVYIQAVAHAEAERALSREGITYDQLLSAHSDLIKYEVPIGENLTQLWVTYCQLNWGQDFKECARVVKRFQRILGANRALEKAEQGFSEKHHYGFDTVYDGKQIVESYGLDQMSLELRETPSFHEYIKAFYQQNSKTLENLDLTFQAFAQVSRRFNIDHITKEFRKASPEMSSAYRQASDFVRLFLAGEVLTEDREDRELNRFYEARTDRGISQQEYFGNLILILGERFGRRGRLTSALAGFLVKSDKEIYAYLCSMRFPDSVNRLQVLRFAQGAFSDQLSSLGLPNGFNADLLPDVDAHPPQKSWKHRWS
jgi:hypothetical protein